MRKIDIDSRTLEFGVRIVRFVNLLPKTVAGAKIGSQLIRSGTSIGANVEEALGGHTKMDFKYKINIAKKEARETKYWLKLIIISGLTKSNEGELLLKEADELVAILSTIVKNTRS